MMKDETLDMRQDLVSHPEPARPLSASRLGLANHKVGCLTSATVLGVPIEADLNK